MSRAPAKAEPAIDANGPSDAHDHGEGDPYDTDVHRWWHLSGPSPELPAAWTDGFLAPEGRVLDVGWRAGLGARMAG